MKNFGLIIVALLILGIFSGCYATITGTVIDAETGEPIEGAVVFVEWTVTKGLGLTYTKSYELVEVVTDKEGKVVISGLFNPFVNPPEVTVYKKGYVVWNNKFIFPDYEHRKDFKWRNGYMFKLEHFKTDYSYNARRPKLTHYFHIEFINSVTHSAGKTKFRKALEWEENKASKEENTQILLRITGKVVDAETGEPIEGAVVWVKGVGIGYTKDKGLEFVSDKEGMVTIFGYFPMLVNPPGVTIYKKGYVAWNSWYFFPEWHLKDRKDFKWQDGYMFKVEKWKSEYNRQRHVEFIRGVTFNANRESKLLTDVLEWEEKHSR